MLWFDEIVLLVAWVRFFGTRCSAVNSSLFKATNPVGELCFIFSIWLSEVDVCGKSRVI